MNALETYEIAYEYAADVAEGRIETGKLARLACERFLADLEKEDPSFPWVFDPFEAHRAVTFIQALPHVQGKLAQQGARFILEPWQVFIVANLFGWVNDETGLRRYLYAYIEVPRGNGKSLLLSAIGLYLAFGEGVPGAEVYSAATSEAQSRIVYDSAKLMVERSRSLRRALGVKPYIKRISQPSKASFFEPLPGIPRDGKRVYGALADELHEWDSQAPWDSLAQSLGKVDNGMMIAATTAGYDLASFCFRYRSDIVSILEGKAQDDRTFGIIYSADPEDDWKSEEAIKKANPNLHISVSLDTILAERAKAERDPSFEGTYKTKRLCLWVRNRASYFDIRRWNDLATTEDILALKGSDWAFGLDLAAKDDLSAFVAATKQEGILYVYSHFFLPRDVAEERATRVPYLLWEAQGDITLTPGAVVDQDFIEKFIVEMSKKLKPRSVGFDPHNSTQLLVNLRKKGVPVLEIPTVQKHISEPTAEVKKLITSGQLRHSNNAVMNWCIENTQAYEDAGGRVKPERPKDKTKKIDGTIALVNALKRIMDFEKEPKPLTKLLY